MPSAIDATKPVTGIAAVKADFRSNFAAAKTELEHGGFHTGPETGNVEYAVGDKLDGWLNVKSDFGAAGDNSTDDTVAIQTAIDSNRPVYFPYGWYKVTAPLEYTAGFKWRGESPLNFVGTIPRKPQTKIFSTFGPEPMIHPVGVWVERNGTVHKTATAGLSYVQIDDMILENTHVEGTVAYLRYLLAPSRINGCIINSARRGLNVTSFDAMIQNCYFTGAPNANLDLDDWADIESSWALALAGEATLQGCFFQTTFTGLHLQARGCNVSNLRFETTPLAILLGGPGFNDDGFADLAVNSTEQQWYASYIRGVKFEGNDRDICYRRVGQATVVEDIVSDGTMGAPSGRSRMSIEIRSTDAPTYLRNACIGGTGFDGPLIGAIGGCSIELENVQLNATTQNGVGKTTGITLTNTRIGNANDTYFQHRTAPNDVGWNTGAIHGKKQNATVTLFNNLHLSGLKGFNATKQTVQPKNFGDLETVAQSATTHVVIFQPALVDPKFNVFSIITDAASTLPAGTYRYALAGLWRNGEGSVSAVGGVSHKAITVASGQKVRMSALGSNNAPLIKVYRRLIPAVPVDGDEYRWHGFFLVTAATLESQYEDIGQAFDGAGGPAVPASAGGLPLSGQEDDASYAIVATPSWATTCWVTNKATTGFTLAFGTAAPVSATVQWLLFRP